MGFFLVGVAAHHLPPAWLRRPDLLAAAAAVLAGSILTDWLEPLRALSLGWVSLALAAGWRRGVDAARFGDLSYGVYIVHFPVIQALVAAGAFVAAPLLAAAAAVGLVLLASILMWWGVERPALRTDSAYRRA
jgi:peptidoglycan/LPS O-acetylase OafA/YrhL